MSLESYMNEVGQKARAASRQLTRATTEQKNKALFAMADALEHARPRLKEENAKGFLVASKKSDFTRRQDCPPVYELNGSIYVINTISIRNKEFSKFEKVIKYVMEDTYSIDIDKEDDFLLASELLKRFDLSI